MRGRKPVPTRLRALRGNPGKRPLNRDEPALEATQPDTPTWLTGEPLDRWQVIAPQLAQLGLLTTIDVDALAAYCQVWARWRKAEDAIVTFGQVIKTPKGYPVQSPYIGIANIG